VLGASLGSSGGSLIMQNLCVIGTVSSKEASWLSSM
jgi:hypothetical protein